MSLDEGISRFIGTIYESVFDADAWDATMRALMCRTGSRLLFVSCADLREREYSKTSFYGADESGFAKGLQEYAECMYRLDPSLSWASQNPNAGMCDTTALMPDRDFRRTEYVRWQEDRLGTVHWRVFYTPPVDDFSFSLSLHPPPGSGPAQKGTESLHRLLFEHVTRALRLAARPPDLAASSEATIILDTAGQVLTMSPRAEQHLCEGDGIRIEGRRLCGRFPEISSRLDSAIASAVTSNSLGGAGGGVRLPRGHPKPDWLALVSPCPRFLEHLPVRTPAAVLRIVESQPRPTLSRAHADLFDLSPREAEVAQALLSGHSVESLCLALSISRNTAKVHLQSVFRKTATHRQSELVHLLSNLVRP